MTSSLKLLSLTELPVRLVGLAPYRGVYQPSGEMEKAIASCYKTFRESHGNNIHPNVYTRTYQDEIYRIVNRSKTNEDESFDGVILPESARLATPLIMVFGGRYRIFSVLPDRSGFEECEHYTESMEAGDWDI